MGRSLADKLAEFDMGDGFDAGAQAMIDALEEPAGLHAHHQADTLPGAPMPTQTHEQVVGLMVRILEMGSTANQSAGRPHPALGTALRIMRRMEGETRQSIANVPEADLQRWLGGLADEINRSIGRGSCPHCGGDVSAGTGPTVPPGT